MRKDLTFQEMKWVIINDEFEQAARALKFPSLTFREELEKIMVKFILKSIEIGVVKPVAAYKRNLIALDEKGIYDKPYLLTECILILTELQSLFVDMGSPIPGTAKLAQDKLIRKGFNV